MFEKIFSQTYSLNFPLVTTFVVDYLLIGVFVGAWYFLCVEQWIRFHSNDSINDSVGAAMLIIMVAVNNFARETFFWYLFRDSPAFSKYKTDFSLKANPSFYWDIARSLSVYAAFGAIPTYFGIVKVGMVGKNFNEFFSAVSYAFWMAHLSQDNIAMRFVHPIMHKREYYWMHKYQ